jgi:hypothetical protein
MNGPAEDLARPIGGQGQEDQVLIRANDFYPECWRRAHQSDDGGDTPCASGHHVCDLLMCMCSYELAGVES